MHKNVEAVVVELCLHAVRNTEGPRVGGAVRIHVRHEYPATTLSRDRVVLGLVNSTSIYVSLCTSGLKASILQHI